MAFLFIIICIILPLLYISSLGGFDSIFGIILLCWFIVFCFNIKKQQKVNNKQQKEDAKFWKNFYDINS